MFRYPRITLPKLFLLLALFSYLSGCREEGKRPVKDDFVIKELYRFAHEDGYAMRMWADDSLIYISNQPDFSVFVYTHSGKFLRKIGRSGSGPNEFQSIWEFSRVSNNPNFCWMQDYTKNLLKLYNEKDSNVVFTTRIQTRNNVVRLNEDVFLIPRFLEKKNRYVISKYKAKSDTYLQDFDVCGMFDAKCDEYHFEYALAGNFSTNGIGEAVYFLYASNIFYIFQQDDVKGYYDIRGEKPFVGSYMSGNRKSIKNRTCGALSGAMDNTYVYLMTPRIYTDNWGDADKAQVDVYKIEDGEFLFSFPLPNLSKYGLKTKPISIAKVKDGLIVRYKNNEIVKYSVPLNFLK